jgi:hypothetical protein
MSSECVVHGHRAEIHAGSTLIIRLSAYDEPDLGTEGVSEVFPHTVSHELAVPDDLLDA